MKKRKVSSRELGLVATEKLLGVEDLHYGYWDDRLELKPQNVTKAQEHYTEFLLSHFPEPGRGEARTKVIDIGCGSGSTLVKLIRRGYDADGLCPAPALCDKIRERLQEFPDEGADVFQCKFEKMPAEKCDGTYDVGLFSESFQYIKMPVAFDHLAKLLKPGGKVIICDFFRTEHDGDGGPGDKSFGGGHDLQEFYDLLKTVPFKIETDIDITPQISPNLELLNDILMNRVKPVLQLTDEYLEGRNPWIYKTIRWFARKRIEKINYKYFSGHRTKATFERYKVYRLLVLVYKAQAE